LIVKVLAELRAVVAPPGRTTVTLADPWVAIAVFGTAAVTLVALTKVVVRAVVPKLTTAPVAKYVPVTVRVNAAPPCVADVLLRRVSVGAAVMVKVLAEETADAPFSTVTLTGPAVASWAVRTAAVS
jgi:hypothetical protein